MGILSPPGGIVTPEHLAIEANIRYAADQLEQAARIEYDHIYDSSRQVGDSDLQQQVDTLSGLYTAIAAPGGAPTSLTRKASTAKIASIGGDGVKTTVDTVGPHGKLDGDFETISGTTAYNGDTPAIDVISTTRFEYPSPITAATETKGYASTKRLFLANTSSFALNQYIDVVSDTGDHYRSQVDAVSGVTVTLRKPIPIDWIDAKAANSANPVSWTPLEVAGGSDAVPHGTDVYPTLPRAMRWVTGGQYYLDAFRAPGDSDAAAFTKACAAAPSNSVLVIRQDIDLTTGYTTVTRTTPLTIVAQAGTNATIMGPSSGTLFNLRANLHMEGVKVTGWAKVINLNSMTAADVNVKARFIRCSFANLGKGISWDTPSGGSLKNVVIHGCDFDTLGSHAVYLSGALDGAMITNNVFESVTTICVRIGVKILNPTPEQQNQWKNIVLTGNIARNIVGTTTGNPENEYSVEGFQIFGYNADVSGNQVDGMVGVSNTSEMSAFYTAVRRGTISNNSARGLTKGSGSATVFVFNAKGSSYQTTPGNPETSQGYGTTMSDNKAYCNGEGYAFRVQNGDIALHHNYAEDPGQVGFLLSAEANDHILLDHNGVRGTKRANVTAYSLNSLGSGVRAEGNGATDCQTGIVINPTLGLVGTAVAATATTLTLPAAASPTTAIYWGMRVVITGGLGRGQSRTIASYDGPTKTATVAAWNVIPDTTSTFQIAASNYVVRGNNIQGAGDYGIRVMASGGLMGIDISDNIVGDMAPLTAAAFAIYVNPTSAAGELRDVVVDHNIISNINPVSADAYGIYINAVGLITNLHMNDNVMTNLWPLTGLGRCIRFAGQAVAGVTTIQQNDMSGFSNASIIMNPVPLDLRLSNNRGYVTEAGGVYTSTPGAVTTVTFPHGLATTPILANVTPGGVQSRNAGAYYVTMSATNINIIFATALTAAASYSWNWSARCQS